MYGATGFAAFREWVAVLVSLVFISLFFLSMISADAESAVVAWFVMEGVFDEFIGWFFLMTYVAAVCGAIPGGMVFSVSLSGEVFVSAGNTFAEVAIASGSGFVKFGDGFDGFTLPALFFSGACCDVVDCFMARVAVDIVAVFAKIGSVIVLEWFILVASFAFECGDRDLWCCHGTGFFFS